MEPTKQGQLLKIAETLDLMINDIDAYIQTQDSSKTGRDSAISRLRTDVENYKWRLQGDPYLEQGSTTSMQNVSEIINKDLRAEAPDAYNKLAKGLNAKFDAFTDKLSAYRNELWTIPEAKFPEFKLRDEVAYNFGIKLGAHMELTPAMMSALLASEKIKNDQVYAKMNEVERYDTKVDKLNILRDLFTSPGSQDKDALNKNEYQNIIDLAKVYGAHVVIEDWKDPVTGKVEPIIDINAGFHSESKGIKVTKDVPRGR